MRSVSILAERWLVVVSLALFAAYVVYAIVFLHTPVVNNDEVWMLSRGEYVLRHGHVAEPTMSAEVAPFFSNLFRAGIVGPVSGIIYYGTLALGHALNPTDPVVGYRLLMLAWAILAIVTTYAVARQLGLDRSTSLFALGWLAALPEMLAQAHTERFEVMLTAGILLGVLLLLKGLKSTSRAQRNLWLSAAALYAWVPAIFIHYSGICLPPIIVVLYVVMERRRAISVEAVVLALLLVPGTYLFAELLLAPSKLAGGVFSSGYIGPPILTRGWWHFAKTPLHLFERLQPINASTRYVSASWFILSAVAAAYAWHRGDRARVIVPLTVAVTMTITLVLVSGSTGPYVVMIAPWSALLLAVATRAVLDRSASRDRLQLVLAAAMVLAFSSSLYATEFYAEQHRVFQRLQADVARAIPAGRSVLAQPLYYFALRDRPFTSSVWVSAFSGRPEQSFKEAVTISGSEYIVADDMMMCMALKGARDSVWMNDMMRFFERDCELVGEIRTHYFNQVTRVAPGLKYPAPWADVDPGFIQRVRIYRRRSMISDIDAH